MSNVWGKNINLTIFGESHGDGLGVVIGNLPAGIELNMELINENMRRRSPGKTNLETPRKEDDKCKIISGYFNGFTTGSPLCMIIENKNKISSDYDLFSKVPRPGHADFTAFMKYRGFNDYRGGGHFSGRITAGIVFAGSIAQQILDSIGIKIGAYITKVGTVEENFISTNEINEDLLKRVRERKFPGISDKTSADMESVIVKTRENDNSIGGKIRCLGLNIPVGLGEPFFDSIESTIAHLAFSIPAVKAIEFGKGVGFSELTGKDANDEFILNDGIFETKTNNSGGVLGGITTGMPIDFTLTFKPTPSIGLSQNSVNMLSGEHVEINIRGRHDPCILVRAVPVVESILAICLLDFLLGEEKDIGWWK